MVFWRHIVGITFILLGQNPRLYDNGMMFLGLWLGTVVIALVGASLVTGLLYLFFTTRAKGKAWRIFVVIAWTFAFLQLFGEWALPAIVHSAASASPTSQRKATPPANPFDQFDDPVTTTRQRGVTPPDWDKLLTREEYDRRKGRADVICRKGSFVDFDCEDEVLRGKK